MEYKGKNIVVLGMARSGIATAKKLAGLGARVIVSESRPESEIDPQVLKELQKIKVEAEFSGHTSRVLQDAELIVVSPGVHLDIPIIKEAFVRSIPVISEVELAYRFFTKPIIAVTGTNGKTTTTTLIGEMLKAARKKVAVAGNIGTPLIEVDDTKLDFIIVEISSYQLEAIKTFRPWISVFLNLTEDHLERHKTFESYAKAKARIFLNQMKTDFLIYNAEDKFVSGLVESSPARKIAFSTKRPQALLKLDPKKINIKGEHNLENSLAATAAALIVGVGHRTIEKVLKRFKGVEHRIEFVRSVKGVDFYNDSKATNPNSTCVALKTLMSEGPIVLILGGREKGADLLEMCELIKETAKHVILLGEATQRFKTELASSDFNNIEIVKDIKEAAQRAYKAAQKGDLVLLSPACASFDMFKDFEERGRVFKEAVKRLK